MFLALHKHYSRYPDDDANAAQEALRAAKEATERAVREREESQQLADVSVASFANTTSSAGAPNGGKQLVGILKTGGTGTAKKVKPKLTAKEKKERSVRHDPSFCSFVIVDACVKMAIDKAVMSLPLEFRGQDPVRQFIAICVLILITIKNLRRNVESVIESLMDKPGGVEREASFHY